MTAAAREMSRQVDFFQQVMISNDTLSNINGLWGQASDIQMAVGEFRDQLRNKATGEKLMLGYLTIEKRVKGVLDVISQVKDGHPSIQLAARALQTANNDLHFAVVGPSGAAKPGADAVYRQTLSAIACNENIKRTIGWLYAERPALKGWTTDLNAVRDALDKLQQLQDKKAADKDIKAQFAEVEKVWAAVVSRYKDTVEQERLLIANRVAKEDQVYGQMATLLGVKDRRAPLTNSWSD